MTDLLEQEPRWRGFLLGAGEALPLAVFLIYVALADPKTQAEWRGPYYAATAVAVAATALRMGAGLALNRIFFALTLYFISGSIALATHWLWLNELYGRMEATAMLWWVLLVGAAFTAGSASGFVGIDSIDRRTAVVSSLGLLGVTALATLVSGHFAGNRLLSAYLPFVAVFASHGLIRARYEARRRT